MTLSSMFTLANSKAAASTGFSNGKSKKKRVKTKLSKNAPKYTKNMGGDFYLTDEWRRIRAKVLSKFGYKCLCCGVATKNPHVDHIKPRSLYPHLELIFNNLQVLCELCNLQKSNLHETDYRDSINILRPSKTKSSTRVIKKDGTVLTVGKFTKIT